jgi:RNA polymerase sigma factor (sigma-70 family)
VTILLTHKEKDKNSKDSAAIEEIMKDCEQYMQNLIQYCLQFFGCEYEYAEDCVQDAYVALFETLSKGVDIKNYKAWLYTVTLNYKNKTVKKIIKQNEATFSTNEEKDYVMENSSIYTSNPEEETITDESIERAALQIISSLNSEEKELYIMYYLKRKKLKEIAAQLNLPYPTVRKRHEKLKKKIKEKIRNFDFLNF